MAAAAPFFTIGSFLVSAVGLLSAGQASYQAYEYNAKVAENEAVMARQAADIEEKRFRRRVQAMLGSTRAATAGSGLLLEGSAMEVLGENAAQSELDALAIRYAGTVGEVRARAQAATERLQGRAARTSSYWQAGGTLLTGAAKYGEQQHDRLGGS